MRAVTSMQIMGLALTLGLAGCQTLPGQPLDASFGEALRASIEAQVINPEAGAEEHPPATLDGQKAEHSLDQYRRQTPAAETRRLVTDVGS